MRKGRGLVDIELYNEMVKIPGADRILMYAVTNHRVDRRTRKVRAEIHEDAWPEVKQMVSKWKKFKREKNGKKVH